MVTTATCYLAEITVEDEAYLHVVADVADLARLLAEGLQVAHYSDLSVRFPHLARYHDGALTALELHPHHGEREGDWHYSHYRVVTTTGVVVVEFTVATNQLA